MPDIASLVARLTATPARAERLRHLATVPARESVGALWPAWAPDALVETWVRRGVALPWSHQVEAADAAWAGEHVVVATGTASGKSLSYQLPALTAALTARGPRGQRGATTLYLAPTKALAADQAAALDALATGVRIATHDGDSSREQREWARDHAEIVLTNPDMLHHSLLPGHEFWDRFWATLRFVVIDECHHYRGVFGAHVGQVIRRLRRVAAQHGADPVFILASATVSEPEASATRLTGLPVRAVTADGSPKGELTVALWEPPFTSHTGENGAPVRRSATAETADILTDLVIEDVRTLAFVRSRQGVEYVAEATAAQLAEVDPALAGRVASYRGGYLPEERRELEADLREGRLLAMAATNALELGIDISGLDAVVMAGFPGTRAAFWQQVGRAGRQAQDALGLFVARDDPLDTYLVAHPEALLGASVEATVFDPHNPHVLRPHLAAAAAEVPLVRADLELFGPTSPVVVEELVDAGLLRARPHGWFWSGNGRASDLADLRSTGGRPITLIDTDTGRVVGTVDVGRSHSTAHAGAVYVHRGESWLVDELDLEEGVAFMQRRDLTYSTSAREVTSITIQDTHESVAWGACQVSFGEVAVTHRVVSFLRKDRRSGSVIGEVPLALPARDLRTQAVWWTVPASHLSAFDERILPGAAHAAEHCSIGLLPLLAVCDRWDIGGVSTALHPDTGTLTVFVYDGWPGGAGFARRGFDQAHLWLTATRDAILACECADGCPSCVQSPKCGNQNNPLDKAGAVRLLDVVLAGAPSGDQPGPACA